jgi:phenylalanyl-tRNA synthetase beta chain
MNIVYSWLKDFVDISVPADELANALTRLGLEVASVRTTSVPSHIKVAKLLEVSRHPNADRLTVCSVDAGGPAPLTIVCGAPNVKAGMLAPLAMEGAVLGPELTVKKAKLRGVESHGMLCSERELGLSDDHSGIMALSAQCRIGEELSVYYPDDAVMEIEIVPSRGDCLSMIGIAREVAAHYGLPLKQTALRPLESPGDPISASIDVQVTDVEGCPRYAGRLVKGITIQPSPDWMQRRLTLAGLRPINNVVDITNYLLLHFGQPMHAFDYNRIAGKKIIVRTAPGNERFVTLDSVERALIAGDLLIRDGERPVALAGIMGGAGSEIASSTTDVFIECAFFNPVTIRKTSKRLGLSTDSSYRFERGVDPEDGLTDALDSAAALMQRLCGGAVAAGRIDIRSRPFAYRTITVRPSRVGKVLGQPFTIGRIAEHLASIGFACTIKNEDALQCGVPSFRHDCTIEEDLIEEIGRLHGYDSIPASNKARIALDVPVNTAESNADALRHALAYAGFNEIVTNSLTSEKRRTLLTPDTLPVAVLNPLSPEMAEMRTTLAATMLETLRYNLNRNNANHKLFEIGKTYHVLPSHDIIERDVLGIIMEGDWYPPSIHMPSLGTNLFTVKGILNGIANAVGNGECSLAPIQNDSPLFGTETVTIRIGTAITGVGGKVSPAVMESFDLKTVVYFIECDITGYLQMQRPTPHYFSLPRYPAVLRDFCFVMPETLSAGTIADEIRSLSPLIASITPFDLYRGEKIGTGLKSIAYSVQFRSGDATLSEKEVDPLCATIIRTIELKFGAKLRT